MSTKSGIQETAKLFSHFEKTDSDLFNHIIIGMDVDRNGRPISKILKTQSPPIELLGLIDVLIDMLTETRNEVREKLNQQDKISRLVSKLPGELGDKIKDLELRMRNAADRLDSDEMKRIQAELDELLESSKGNIIDLLRKLKGDKDNDDNESGDDDFNIKDFMGGL